MSGNHMIDELVSQWEEARARGEQTSVEELCRHHPELIGTVESAIARRRAASVEATTEWSSESRPEASFAGESESLADLRAADEETEHQLEGLGPPQGPDEIGRLGPFRVTRLLGSGGMGSVFQAVDPQLGRSVALKVLRPRLAGSEIARQRFLREARAAASLEHDHVVAIYQVGEDHGVPYLAMQLLRGQSLHNLLQGGNRLPVAEVLRIGRETAEGLAAAHAHGLIHRDIKPANIWLEEETGRVKILDFGLARSAEDAVRLTQDGTILGTPAFMSPEQASGARQVDHRSDLFSLGCVLYRMATGRTPFAANNHAAMLYAIACSDSVPPRELNPSIAPALNDLILRLLAKDPAARPQSARAVVEAIRGLEREPSQTRAVPAIVIDTGEEALDSLVLRPAKTARPRSRRWKPLWIAAAPLAALLLVGGLLAAVNMLPTLSEQLHNEGTLALQAPGPTTSVAVAVKRDGRIVGVLDSRSGPELRLEAGVYELVLSDTAEPLKLASERIIVGRGERKVVRVVRVARGPAAGWQVPATITPWQWPGDKAGGLPGLIADPPPRPDLARWQIETRRPRKPIIALAWSPDGKQIACATRERLVRIYNAAHLELVRVLVGDGDPFSAVAWSPDGKHLATGSEDGTVRYWGADGTPGPVVHRHSAEITALAWRPDSEQLASASMDTTTILWGPDGTPGPVLSHPDRVRAVAWGAGGKRLVTGCEDGSVRVWMANGTKGPVYKGHTQPVNAVAWSPDGLRIASGSRDKTVRLWDVDGAPARVLAGHGAGVTALAWNRQGTWLASLGEDRGIRRWKPDGTPGNALGGNVLYLSLAWSPDGRRLAAGGRGRQFLVWDTSASDSIAARLAGYPPVDALAVHPGGRRLASSAEDNDSVILVWGPDNSSPATLKGHSQRVNVLAWSPDGKRIVSGSEDTTVRLWSADGTPGPVLEGHDGAILALAWSPDGKHIVSGSRDRTVRIWTSNGVPGPILTGNTQAVQGVAWSADGKQVASAGLDGSVRIWDADGTPRPVRARFTAAAECVGWSPDGTRLAAGNRANELQLWAAGGEAGPTLRGNSGHVTALAWHPDSARLAVGSNESTVRLWDIGGTSGPVLSLDPESDACFVTWADRGALLVAGGHAGLVRAWNGRTLEPEWTAFPTAPKDVTVFNASGRLLRSTPTGLKELAYLVERPGRPIALLSHAEFEKPPAAKTSQTRKP